VIQNQKWIIMAATDEEQPRKNIDELTAINNKLDQQLANLEGTDTANTSSPSSTVRKWYAPPKLLVKALLLVAGLVIPFVVLVRTSVYMYLGQGFNGWLAITVGLAAAVTLLLGYALYATYKYNNRVGLHPYLVRGVLLLVTAFTLYGVLYYSSTNTKTDAINSYYRSLHPIMRVALTTITLADSDLVVTDIQREPADYAQMGLPENQQSLHYVQSDGYVHAVDIRTRNRAEWKNWMTQAAFRAVGLQTIRHVGTADHLHVYLPLNE
jgi:hypothetical protein